VRLLGFEPGERNDLDAILAQAHDGGPTYTCMADACLHEPDFYIADGDGPAGLAALTRANPGPVQPAMVVARAPSPLPFPHVARPFQQAQLHAALAGMVERRAQALALLRTCTPVDERRRQGGPAGTVLILDNRGAFRDHVAGLLGERRIVIEWTDSLPAALKLCDETRVALVMIDTGTARADPYAACAAIKAQHGAFRTAVVLLCGRGFQFDHARGRDCGLRGVLAKPVGDRELVAVLNRLLSWQG
jgi:CheY-like chemotaxis protein